MYEYIYLSGVAVVWQSPASQQGACVSIWAFFLLDFTLTILSQGPFPSLLFLRPFLKLCHAQADVLRSRRDNAIRHPTQVCAMPPRGVGTAQ